MNVSIIVNCFREEKKWFDIAIKSILAQKDVDVHLILSTIQGDSCIKWIKEYKGDIEVVTLPHAHEKTPDGSFKQLNNAIPHIKNDFVCFCSANDYQMPDKCKNEISKLKNGKHVCYSAFYIGDLGLNIMETKKFHTYDINKHLKSNFVYDSAMVRSTIFKKYMPFTTKWHNMGYWDLWLRIYKDMGNVFAYNPKPARKYIKHYDSMHILRSHNHKLKIRVKNDRADLLRHHKEILNESS
jgi:hypothetical protein